MQLYSCRVRLKGSLLNVVNKENVTAAEIRILDHIHVGDNPGVYDIKPEGSAERSDRVERERLAALYGEFGGMTGAQIVNTVLGVSGVPLPQGLDPSDERLVTENGIRAARRANLAAAQAKSAASVALEDMDIDVDMAPESAAQATEPMPVRQRAPRPQTAAA